jgi:hypothetical protein
VRRLGRPDWAHFGIPRGFSGYDGWVQAIAPIIDADAVPESTFFWWDVRLVTEAAATADAAIAC